MGFVNRKQEKNDEKSMTVDEILSAGKRHLACGENQEAADCFEDACGQLLVCLILPEPCFAMSESPSPHP